MRSPSLGSVFAGHRLESILGTGGMGVVYLATHERLKRLRALKVISPDLSQDNEFRRRFERESELAASIEHPHVIPIYDAGEDGGQLYIAMRYVEGADMNELIRRRGKLEPGFTARIVGQVAAALDAAHQHGLVHRDVKPANVVIESKDPGDAFLTDFGLTKVVDSQSSALTETGKFVGTLDYIAPEQLSGQAAPSADVYSLGCLTFQALTGEVPYPHEAAPAKMWAHINAEPPRLDNATRQLANAVARAMAKRPEDRFPTAGEFAHAVTEAIASITPRRAPMTAAAPTDPATTERARTVRPAKALGTSTRRRARRPPALLAGGALVVAGVVAGIVAMSSGGDHPGQGRSSEVVKPLAGGITIRARPFGQLAQPSESIRDAANRFSAAVKEVSGRRPDCSRLQSYVKAGILHCRSVIVHGRECGRGIAKCERFHVSRFPDFKLIKRKVFGSGGVIEFTDAQVRYPKTNNVTLAIDRDGRYMLTGPDLEELPHVSVGTAPSAWATADAAAARFLHSLRSKNCDLFWKVTLTPRVKNKQQACERLLRGTYAEAAAQLRNATPRHIDVFRLGGTTDFYFYGVRVHDRYRTLVFVKSKKNYVYSLFPPRGGIPVG